jgi:hypothetical protein
MMVVVVKMAIVIGEIALAGENSCPVFDYFLECRIGMQFASFHPQLQLRKSVSFTSNRQESTRYVQVSTRNMPKYSRMVGAD